MIQLFTPEKQVAKTFKYHLSAYTARTVLRSGPLGEAVKNNIISVSTYLYTIYVNPQTVQ